jgi:DNA-binding PadR family transcriptional regulator
MARVVAHGTHGLSASDWAVLALVAEQPSHGWAIASQLVRGGEVGSIWSLGRPIVYHALGRLGEEGLIRTAGLERGTRGPHRVVYEATAKGRKEVREWLGRPIEHVRDIRSLFLLKVVLSQRAGIDIEPLLMAQRAVLLPFLTWIESQIDDADPGVPAELTALTFRLESAHMVIRFIDGLLAERSGAPRQRIPPIGPAPDASKPSATRSSGKAAARPTRSAKSRR